ncbi:UNVERIFIED_CONTAM: hypothetical protein RMT77_011688 [Armadillidium vulgare]
MERITMNFISDILKFPLKDENVLLLYDREVLNYFQWTEYLLFDILKNKPHITLSLQEFDASNYDSEIISGFKHTTICLIYNQSVLLDLFQNKTVDLKWAPAKLLIIFLDHKTTISEEIFDSSIQRSKHILIAELTIKNEKFTFQTYSISPFAKNKISSSQWKIFKGIYSFPGINFEMFTDRIKDFGRKVLNLASITNNCPLLYEDNNGNNVGVNLDILYIISRALNFTYTVQKKTEDGFWAALKNNTLIGMFRDLYYNNKDLIINYVFLVEEEYKYFDISFPYQLEGFGFVNNIPDPIPDWRKLFMPFSRNLWSFFLFTFFGVILIFFFMMKIGIKNKNIKFFHSLLQIIGILFRQSVKLTSGSVWFSCFISVWMIGSFIIMTAYSGNLISYVTFPHFPKRIESIQELVHSNKKVGTLYYGEPFIENLLSSPVEALRKLGKNVYYYPNHLYDFDELIDELKNNRLVLTDISWLMFCVQNDYNLTAKTYLMKEQIFQRYLSFIFKKHSPLTNPISSKLNRLIETGIYSAILEKYKRKIQDHQPKKLVIK